MNRRTWTVALPLSAALALTFVAVADAEVAYRIEPIEIPADSNVSSLNIKGEVTGTVISFVGGQAIATPILWRKGHYVDLTLAIGNPGESISVGEINDRSVMIGGVFGTTTQSFIFRRPHHRTDLPPQAIAEGINNRNEVFGDWLGDPSQAQAFVWRKGQPITLLPSLDGGGFGSNATGINDRGEVVGFSGPEPQRAVVWSAGTVTPVDFLPGATSAQGNGINNLGQVVGLNAVGNELKAFLWIEGTTVELPPPPECSAASATAINDWGVVIGEAGSCESVDVVAMLWIATQPIRIDDVIATDDPLRAQLRMRIALAINDRGQILVQATDSATGTQNHFVLLTPTHRVGALRSDGAP